IPIRREPFTGQARHRQADEQRQRQRYHGDRGDGQQRGAVPPELQHFLPHQRQDSRRRQRRHGQLPPRSSPRTSVRYTSSSGACSAATSNTPAPAATRSATMGGTALRESCTEKESRSPLVWTSRAPCRPGIPANAEASPPASRIATRSP